MMINDPCPTHTILKEKEYMVSWSRNKEGRYIAGVQPDGWWFEVVGFGNSPAEALKDLHKEYDLSLHMA